MATDLTGLKVKDTYNSLLKIGDNSSLSATPDKISDGFGNESILYLSTSQVSIGVVPASGYDLTVGNSGIKTQIIDIVGAATAASVQLTGGSGSQGTLSWNTDEETVDIIQNGATLQVGQEIHVHVKNQTGSTITDGTPVYVTGTLGASGRLTVAPMIADGTIEAKYFLGITTEDIPNGEDGKVTTFGKIRGLDTSSYSDGQTLFVSASTAGEFQTTAPVAPNLDLEVAIVINSHANNGTIFVRAQQGYYLGMLHDVYENSPSNNDLLVYNTTNSRWENQGIASVGSINLDTVTDNGNTTTNNIEVGDITAGNMTLSGYLRGAGTFVIDPSPYSDDAGVVQILGDLRVDGETTTINSTTVTIDDKNLVLASGSATAADANGAGITIDGADATMTYNSTSDRFVFNKDIETDLIGNVTGDLTGNADTASTLETARNIEIDGAVTGNADFDGSGDITITTSVNHNHDADYVNVTGDTMTGNLDFNDSVKARFGTGDDLTVYHSGLHSFIDNATGALFIRNFADNSDIIFNSDNGSGGLDDYIRIDGSEGSVILYHYGSAKLETTSTGVSVTGALSGNIDTSSISGGTIDINGTTAINLQYNGTTQLRIDSTGVDYLGTVSFSNDGITLTDEDSTIDSFFHANVDYDAGTYTVTSNARYGADYIQIDGQDSRSGNDRVFVISPKDIGSPDEDAILYLGGDNSITAPNTLMDWHTIEMNALSVQINNAEVATRTWVTSNIDLQDVTDNGATTTNSISLGSSSAPKSLISLRDLGGLDANANQGFIATSNHYYDSGDKYIGDGYAGIFSHDIAGTYAGNFRFSLASNNTSGAGQAMTLTDVMRVNSDGLNVYGDTTTTGNLYIGSVGQQNWIAFSGTTGDGGSSATYTTTYIGERIYGGTERSELIIYKGNDGHASTASPDRIRMIGANLCFDTYNIAQTYPTDLDGVAALTTTRAMTIDTNQHVSITNGNLAVETGVIKIGTTTVIDASRNLTNIGAGSFGGNVTFGGYIDVGSTLYSRSNLEVLNAAGTGWNRWATRSNGQYNLDIGSLDVDSTATFNSVAVFNGQVNYNSEDRSTYWSYDDKVAAVFKPAADDGAVAILFPSIGNSVSDFGYIAFDEDYGEAGVTAGENSVLLIGCENDGLNSSDHVRVKGRLVVEADMSSSDPTNAFQVKDGNVTTDLFRVSRSGASVFSSTLNVADQLTVDDAIRLTSNPSITGDSSGVYFWNQSGVGATIASNAFQVKTGGNTTALTIDNNQRATFSGHSSSTNSESISIGAGTENAIVLSKSDNIQCTGNLFIQPYGSNDIILARQGGSVGIGTTSPAYKLDVNSGGSASGLRLIGSNSSYTGAFIANTGSGSASLYFDASNGDFSGGDYMVIRQLNSLRGEISMSANTPAFDISMADVPKFTVLQNGNVGIGTTNPTPHSPSRKALIISDTTNNALIEIHGASGGKTLLQSVAGSAYIAAYGASSGGINFGTGSSGSTKMVINSSGNVGIGTTSPSQKLDVEGSIRLNNELQIYTGTTDIGQISNLSGALNIQGTSTRDVSFGSDTKPQSVFLEGTNGYLGVGTTTPNRQLEVKNSGDAWFRLDGSGSYFDFLMDGNLRMFNSGGERMRITSAGNVGIGTTSPQAKLDVNGTVLLGREHGVTQLNNNKDWANMQSGIVWREYNHSASTHPTTSDAMTELIKGATFTEQGTVANVNSFTRSDDTYVVEFLGYYYATSSDTYSFSISSDDAGDIFIDGTRVADWYNGHGDNNSATGGTGQNTGSIYLVKGFHKIYARYEEIGGGDSASLWHKIGSGSWEKIPANRLYHKAEDLFRATGSGNVTLTGTFTATADIVAYSDERIKDNIETIDNALDKVNQLRGVSFNRKSDGKESIGVIAQEIEKVLPEVVTEDEQGIKGVSYGNIVGVLIEAIKDQQKQIDELKARLDGSTK